MSQLEPGITVEIFETKRQMGQAAAEKAENLLQAAIVENGQASIIIATGASQFEFLEALIGRDVKWGRVTMFHLDEYIGLDDNHRASFKKYLKERFTSKVNLAAVNFIEPDPDDPQQACRAVGEVIRRYVIDAAFVGIGQNGHLAFNDPPADFETDEPYIIVNLDEPCRAQQVSEGWFDKIEDVPKQAVSMSIREILRARTIMCVCPDLRKAQAVKETLEGPITPQVPASILRTHSDCHFFLDKASASALSD